MRSEALAKTFEQTEDDQSLLPAIMRRRHGTNFELIGGPRIWSLLPAQREEVTTRTPGDLIAARAWKFYDIGGSHADVLSGAQATEVAIVRPRHLRSR